MTKRAGFRRSGARRRLPTVVLAGAIAASVACGDPTWPGLEPGAGVLFIGNSLTGANDLPGMVADLAAAAGSEIATDAVVVNGFSLEDHWLSGDAAAAIRRGGWSAVVFQQGPSTLQSSREHLLHWSRVVAEAARREGAAPFLYMVWPPLDGDWQRGIDSYRQAAESIDGGLFPVAEAMRIAWRSDPDLPLLDADDFHPGTLGTYLAAVIIVAQLQNRSPRGLPAHFGPWLTVPPDIAEELQEAAAQAIASMGRS